MLSSGKVILLLLSHIILNTIPANGSELYPIYFALPGFEISPLAVRINDTWRFWTDVKEEKLVSQITDFNDLNFLLNSANAEDKLILLNILPKILRGKYWQKELLRSAENHESPVFLEVLQEIVREPLASFLSKKEGSLRNASEWMSHLYATKSVMYAYNDIIYDASLVASRKSLKSMQKTATSTFPVNSYRSLTNADKSPVHRYVREVAYKEAKNYALRVSSMILKLEKGNKNIYALSNMLCESLVRINFFKLFEEIIPVAYDIAIEEQKTDNPALDLEFFDYPEHIQNKPWNNQIERIYSTTTQIHASLQFSTN